VREVGIVFAQQADLDFSFVRGSYSKLQDSDNVLLNLRICIFRAS